MEAMIGTGSLCLHRMSKTSSKKPSKVAIRRERREDRYTDSSHPRFSRFYGSRDGDISPDNAGIPTQ